MASGGVIGNAVIEVTVDASRIKTGMDTAASSAKTQAAKIAAGTEQVGASAKKQLADFIGGVGRIGAVIGTFSLFLRIGQQIGEMLKTGADRARDFTSALDTRNTGDALAKVNAQIAKLEASMAGAASAGAVGYVETLIEGDTPGGIQKQIDELRKLSGVLQGFENSKAQAAKKTSAAQAAKERREAEQKENATLRESQKRDTESATLENLSGVDRVNEEERRFFDDLEQRRKKSQDREYQAALGIYSIAKQNYFIDQRRTIEAEKQAKIDADKNKATEESLRRQQDIVNAINGIKQSSIDRTAGLITSIENLNQIAARIEQGVRGLR